MSGYYFDDHKRFIIEDYHRAKTFSSFLPGIAGREGIPIWAFYVNRGQGISSFGVENKNNPIMEFTPANGAYQTVSTKGFRTFIKDLNQSGKVFEPFGIASQSCKRRMGIEKESFFVEEINENEGLTVHVRYTTLANMPFGGLVRQTTITNNTDQLKVLEVIDGMPALLPYGVENQAYKAMGNLMQSWMEVSKKEEKIPFYKLRSSTKDESVVSTIESGYFYMSEAVMDDSVLNIYDPIMVFEYQLDFREPVGFMNHTKEELMAKEQVFANKVPSAFQLVSKEIEAGKSITINSVIGYAIDYESVEDCSENISLNEFVNQQFADNKKEIEVICKDIETHSGLPVFDEYIKQSYLDNVLRGGRPYLFESENGHHVYHVFSRKHGDLERDYNFFSLEPTNYSQGNGNYRDVNQNRRDDVIINPEVGDFNVWMFYNLVQADGNNPLSIKGTFFRVEEGSMQKLKNGLDSVGTKEMFLEELMSFASGEFSPGSLMAKLDSLGIDDSKIFNVILKYAKQNIDVAFGEGFWSDHFTYNLDLVESYRYIYPDAMEALLLERHDYKFYNAPYEVLPREQKYCLTEQGTVRQYEAINKKATYDGPWMKDADGREVTTNLFNKMMTLVLTKFMNLDPFGMGLEMEGDKPGWNDALNGLPGLFGSGMSETVELKRCIDFLVDTLKDGTVRAEATEMLINTIELMEAIDKVLKGQSDAFNRWDQLNDLKEDYRKTISSMISGKTKSVVLKDVQASLLLMTSVLEQGIDKALSLGNGILPSYFVNEVTDYECFDHKTHLGLTAIKAKGFDHRTLPKFLEAPARYLKTIDGEQAKDLHNNVLKSNIYDKQLGMFKTSESLDSETMEIGRIRAFTPGWLERESVFMHMTYKYLLSLLSAGLHDAFYEAIQTNMVPFFDPELYGRATTENSSFIASSVNPNPAVVGQGFMARLSGSTAEAISMWVKMFIGGKGFTYEGGQLHFVFEPVLSSDFFDEEGRASFILFGTTKVTYINKQRKHTFGHAGCTIKTILVDGIKEAAPYLNEVSAHNLRDKKIKSIEIYLS